MDEIKELPIQLKKGARTFQEDKEEKEIKKKIRIERMKKKEEGNVMAAEDRLKKRKQRLRKLTELEIVIN